jgi:putative ABC transport system permease protein
MSIFLADLKYAWRSLLKQPAFALTAVAALALGVGLNGAVFAVVYSVLLRPLNYPDSGRLIQIWDNQAQEQTPLSFPEFLSLKDRKGVFQNVAAYWSQRLTITGNGPAENLRGLRTSADLLNLLGEQPAIGAGFSAGADDRRSNREIMISDGLWRRRYAGNPLIVGGTLKLQSQLYTIVGVLPGDFQFEGAPDFLTPLRLAADAAPQDLHFLKAVGRLSPGVTLNQARSAVEAGSALRPGLQSNTHRTTLVSLQEQIVSRVRAPFFMLLGASGFILLIVCANVASLLLVHSASRSRELAIRLALGANPGRIARQLFTESGLMAALGGVSGAILAGLSLQWAHRIGLLQIPRAEEVGLHGEVLVFTFAVSLLAGLLCGSGSVIQVSGNDVAGPLRISRQTTAGVSIRYWHNGLVVAEVALTLMLLIGSGLLIRSFLKILESDKGFRAEGVMSLEFNLSGQYSRPEQVMAFYSEMLNRLAAQPGVESAGVISTLPLIPGGNNGTVKVSGAGAVSDLQPTVDKVLADGRYFSTMGIPLLQGRLFEERDSARATPVAIIDETLARQICGTGSCFGKSIDSGWGKPAWSEVVGVVGRVRQAGLDAPPQPTVYMPYAQKPELLNTIPLNIVARTSLNLKSATAAFRQAVLEEDKDQPAPKIRTMNEIADSSVARRRGVLTLLSVFAGLGLFLAIIGVYGVMSHSVAARSSEFSIRIALGAQRRDVLKLVLGHGLRLAAAGIALGAGGGLAGAKLLTSMLYGTTPADPLTFAGVAVLMGAVVLAACCIPAWRAVRVDPLRALKYE